MKSKVKLPTVLCDAISAYCKKEGKVDKLFYQKLVEIYFTFLTVSKELVLFSPAKEPTRNITVELDDKFQQKVDALAEFYGCRSTKALSSIFIVICMEKNIFYLPEYDYQLFSSQHLNVLERF